MLTIAVGVFRYNAAFVRGALVPSMLTFACAAAHTSVAQEGGDDSLRTYKEPEVVYRRAPDYPSEALYSGREGWVKVSYVVGTDGAVTNAMIEDSSGVRELEGAALKAVGKWRYKPATLDGKPIEQSMTQTIIRFQLADSTPGATGKFVATYRKAQEHLNKGELDEAKSFIDELDTHGRLNLYEDSWFWWLKYEYSLAAGDASPEELRSMLTASVDSEGDYLPPDALVLAMVRLFSLRVQTQDFTKAVSLLTRLKGSKPARKSQNYAVAVQGMEETVRKIDDLAGSDAMLKFEGSIGRFDYFVHGLLRRAFTITDINGRIDAVDIRCDHGYSRYAAVTGQHTWTVPSSWGNCGAYVRGEPGTTFVLYEPPKKE